MTAVVRQPIALALILVAEDERGWAIPLVGALRQHGVVAKVVTKPEAARAMLAERLHRLVVLGSGPGVAAFARELRRDTACTSRRAWVLAVCPDAATGRLLELRDAGVSAVVIGPVTFARVEERLRAMARDRRKFVEHASYVGPDRRLRRDVFLPPDQERRDVPSEGRPRPAAPAEPREAAV